MDAGPQEQGPPLCRKRGTGSLLWKAWEQGRGGLCRPPSLSAQLVQALPSPPALTTLKLICGSSLCCPNSSHPLKGYSVAIPFRQYGEEVCEEPDGMGLHALSVTYKLCNLGQNELAFLCFVCTENNGNNTYPINCKN